MKSLHSSFFCVPSSFGQSAKKFRWMLNGIRPFSFIRLITWKYIRLSFALLCFFFGIFLGLNAENAFVTFAAGSSVCAFQMWTFVAACCSNFTYLSMHEADDVNFISHANRSCHIGPFFLIRHNWYACPNFHFTPSTGTAYIWISWLQTFSMPLNFLFLFFSSNLIRITASLLQFEFRI